MKYILLALLSWNVLASLDSPRDSMRTFLKAMVQVKKANNVELNYIQAYTTVKPENEDNLSLAEKKVCNSLIAVFDRMEKIDYNKIPKKLDSNKWIYDKRYDAGSILEIAMVQNQQGQWTFSSETISSLDGYLEFLKDKEVVQGVTKLESYADRIRAQLPPGLQGSFLALEYWQWLVLFAYVFVAFLLERICHLVFSFLINSRFVFFESHDKSHLENLVRPLSKIVFFAILIHGLTYLDLRLGTYTLFSKILYVLSSIMLIWFGKKLIEVSALYFKEKAALSDTKFDDILVPLLAKTSYVFLYLVGSLLLAYSIEVDVTGIIAGLGIGGLAFAFAAKDTLANFFGSIMLVLDRPFDIGDVIETGSIIGTVEEVGFRSTRVRTFYDSLITVSNGQLANQSIDNKGKRRYRRLNTVLGVEYDTPPKKIQAFCEGIRQLIIAHKWTRKDNFNVYFTNFGASALEITVIVFWETADYSRELAEKHRLMLDILRLAKEMNINFAFPTQTLHLFRGQKDENYSKEEIDFGEVIERAKKVASKPYSLKNPRSNLNEKDQFGDNDFGL